MIYEKLYSILPDILEEFPKLLKLNDTLLSRLLCYD